jgi:hypothetical protein
MLLSQRIAQDPRFLERTNSDSADLFKHTSFADIRRMVLNAEKFIVGREMVSIEGTDKEKLARIWDISSGGKSKITDVSFEEAVMARAKRHELYLEFAKPPFPLMVLESDEGLILLEQSKGYGPAFKILTISANGLTAPYWTYSRVGLGVSDLIPREDILSFFETTLDGYSPPMASFPQKTVSNMTTVGYVHVCMAMECLLFANIANTRMPVYNPVKRELKAIPKVLQQKFSYRILNIFRDRKEYHSMEDVNTLFERSEEEVQQRRAHLVRGHFKRINGKLFWWNSFLRNAKNIDTLGGVVKDYQLK